MRNLQNKDVFAIGRIISKANLKEELKEITINKDADVESMGFDILFALFTSCSEKEVEQEIYTFFADIFEMTAEEVSSLDPLETIELMKKVADWKKWKTFFSLGAKLKK